MRGRSCLTSLLLWGFALCFSSSQSIAEDSIAAFYKGKQITIAVGTPAGSSASLYSQALARHMRRYLPGSPTFIVQHMPGAGGFLAANTAYNMAPRDGTFLVTTNRTVPIDPLFGGKGAKFDSLRFTWLGSTNVEHNTCTAWHTAAAKSLQDAFTKELVVGSYGADGISALFAKAANKLAGTKFKIVGGYPGGPDVLMAMERREVEGFCAMAWSELKLRKTDWLNEKKVNILFQMGLEKHPDLPHVPLIIDYAKNPDDRKVFELLFLSQMMSRPFYAPPDIPADRVKALRTAFERTLKDLQFLTDAEKMGLEVQHVAGEAVQKLIEQIYASPEHVVQRAMSIAD